MNIGVAATDDLGISLLGHGRCREKSQLCHMGRLIPTMSHGSGRDSHHLGNLTPWTQSGPSHSGHSSHSDEVPGPKTHFCGISIGAEGLTHSWGKVAQSRELELCSQTTSGSAAATASVQIEAAFRPF